MNRTMSMLMAACLLIPSAGAIADNCTPIQIGLQNGQTAEVMMCGFAILNSVSEPGLYVDIFAGGNPDEVKQQSEDQKRTAKQRAESRDYLSSNSKKLYPGQSSATNLGVKDADFIRFPTSQAAKAKNCSLNMRHGPFMQGMSSDQWHKIPSKPEGAGMSTVYHIVCNPKPSPGPSPTPLTLNR